MQELKLEIVRIRTVFKTTKGGARATLQGVFIVYDQTGGYTIATVRAKHSKELREKALATADKGLETASTNRVGSFWKNGEEVYKGCRVLFRQAKDGTGLVASDTLRKLLVAAGVRNASVKVYGKNLLSALQATRRFLQYQNQYSIDRLLAARS